MRSNLYWSQALSGHKGAHALSRNEDHILTSLGYGLAIKACLPSAKELLVTALPYIDFFLNLPAWRECYYSSLDKLVLHHKTRQIDLQRLTLGAINIDLRLDEVESSHLEHLDSLASQVRNRELKSQVLLTQLRICLILGRLDLGELPLGRLESMWDYLSYGLRIELLRIKCLSGLAVGRRAEAQRLVGQLRALNRRETPSLSAAKNHLLSGVLYLIEGNGGMALTEISRGQRRMRSLPFVPELSARLEILRSLAHEVLGESVQKSNSQNRALKLFSDIYQGDWVAKLFDKDKDVRHILEQKST